MEQKQNSNVIDATKTKPVNTNKESLTHKAGDAVERLGEKLQDMGATKVGQAVYKAGDKLEHSGDKKNEDTNH